MTKQADEYWLDIAHHLNVAPRDQDELTVREWEQAVSAITHIRNEAAKQ